MNIHLRKKNKCHIILNIRILTDDVQIVSNRLSTVSLSGNWLHKYSCNPPFVNVFGDRPEFDQNVISMDKNELVFFFFHVEFVLFFVSKNCRLLTCTFVQWAEFHARCMMANNHKQDHSFATVALLLFVETPSLLYPNMSCHRSHIEDSGPCLNVYNNSLKWIGKKREKRKRDSQTVSQTFEVFKGKPHHQSSTQI